MSYSWEVANNTIERHPGGYKINNFQPLTQGIQCQQTLYFK